MKLYDFQDEVLEQSKNKNKVAYYYDMGLGKTFIGAEKLARLNSKINLVVCQKSKIDDWKNHFNSYYSPYFWCFDLTYKKDYDLFFEHAIYTSDKLIGIINYELIFRRPELLKLENFTLLLDESSLIQNDSSKRTKFISKMKPANIILLSGTPTGGKYEKLYSQLKLLGWQISKTLYWNQYVDYYIDDRMGFPLKIIKGYKNVDRLKNKMRDLGCYFKKTDEVFDLPKQNFISVNCKTNKLYKQFRKNKIANAPDGKVLVGDTALTKLLCERQLCGIYCEDKFSKLKDLLLSSDDRFIIFYNFNDEGSEILTLCAELEKPLSLINGNVKDLTNYENENNSVTLIQYQAGAMGLNLQKANKIIYFTPCLSSELFEQSKKRIHRIGQEQNCFYYLLTCENSVEKKIYSTLALRKDFTEKLFEGVENVQM